MRLTRATKGVEHKVMGEALVSRLAKWRRRFLKSLGARKAPGALVLFACADLLLSPPAVAGSGVTVESVNDYQGTADDLTTCIANGLGFKNGMVTGSGFWTAGKYYTNSQVWDGDFVDPDRTGDWTYDKDYANFDRTSNVDAISYFTGHGYCAGGSSQPCTATVQCSSPVAGTTLPGTCRSAPGMSPVCTYRTPRYVFTNGSGDHHGSQIDYTNGTVKFGESSISGTFAGAAINGGVNLVVLDISCGALVDYWYQELTPMFAGLHLVATIMPTNGDTAMVANRGSTFAARWAANPVSGVGTSWLETHNNLSPYLGSACAGNYATGGGHGINGCGAYLIFSASNTQSDANWKVSTEGWYGIKLDSNDGTGAGYKQWGGMCNYDCVASPWKL